MATSTSDEGIDALYAAWADAFRRKDVDAILRLLTPDYILLRPGAPGMTAEAIRPALEAAFASVDIDMAFEREEQIVSGDLAFEQGWDVQTLRPHGGGDGRTQRQHVALVLQRGTDGVWRFARGMIV
jgi:uncharacterized protein (TIGR02246 family)